MTLEEYRNSRYEDLFLAVIKKEIDWNNAERVFVTVEDFPNPITISDLLKIVVREAIIENGETLTQENQKRIEEEAKQIIGNKLGEIYFVILLNKDNRYIELGRMIPLEPEYQIICQIPFKAYYKKEEYSFEEDEDGPYLSIDMKPFEKFVKDYQEGSFN